MKRRNVIGLLAVMIIMTGFGGVAFGQIFIDPPPLYTTPGDYGANLGAGLCAECDGKNAMGKIPIPETNVQQNQPTTVTSVGPFDFDGEPWEIVVDPDGDMSDDANWIHRADFGPTGYCPSYASEDNKFLFDVCQCPEACVVAEGAQIGIEMIIDADGNYDTVDDGVYFADPDLNEVYFNIIQQELPDNQYVWNNRPCDEDTMGRPEGLASTRAFENITYYRSYTENKINSKGLYELSMGTEGTPIDGMMNTQIQEENRVVALQSDVEGGYVIKAGDTQRHCLFWIDIPAMRIDPTRAAELVGNTIRVRVRLLFNRQPTICPDCNPPDYCECVIEVAKISCDAPSNEGCMFIPYVLYNFEGWGTGVAVTARQTLPENAWCQVTLTDAEGNSASYKNTAVKNIWAFVLNNELANFTGDTLLPSGAASLRIESNYSIDGYSFLETPTFGASVLPRGCTEGACAP
ncbi:MAG: hypothetical protein GY795_28450 [Desulfobacterales bacterium]|nr:hypothetical protein [Desulfobacterales bacterium]